MEENKITLIDTFGENSFHEIFNAAFLLSVLNIYQSVTYFGTKSSIENQKKFLTEEQRAKVHYEYVKCVKKKGHVGLLCKYVWAAISLVSVIKKSKSSKIVVLNHNPFMYLFARLIAQDINIICHGEMELINGNDDGKLAKIMTWLLRQHFRKNNMYGNFHYIVLGDSILKNLSSKLEPEYSSYFSSIDHPYIFNDLQTMSAFKARLSVGIVGITTPTKGLSMLKELFKIKADSIDIYHIGKISDNDSQLKNAGLKIVKRDSNNELSRDKYEAWIKKMNFILFLYPTDNYKLTASGAVFESFSMGIPVIALHNDYFDYLSSKIGDFGLFFDNFEQMKSFFAAPYEFDTERMFLSIKKARNLFTSENVSKKLKTIIK